MSASRRGGRVLQNTGWAPIGEIGAKVATFALLAVIARRLGDAEFGNYALAFSVASLAITLADWGHDRVLTREVARDPSRMEHYFANTLALRIVVGLVLVGALVALAPVLGYRSDLRPILALAGMATLVDLLTGTCFAAFQAFQRMGFLPLVLIGQRWATALIGIAAVLLGGSVVAVTAVYLVIAVVALIASVVLVHRFVVTVDFRVDPGAWVGMVRHATPLGVAGLFGIVLFRIDMAMLGAMAGERAVADYAAAYRMLEVTLFLAYSIGSAAYPVFAQRTPTSDPPVAEVYGRSLKLALALTLPLAVGLGVLSGPLLDGVFGGGFHRADDALNIIAAAVVLFPLSYLSGYLLLSQQRDRTLLVITGIVAVGNVIANAVMIPKYSLIGAAINTTAFEALSAVLTVVVARQICGPLPWTRIIVGPAAAAAAAALPMALLSDSLVPATAVGAVVYLGVLFVLERRLWPDDLHALREMLSRRRRGPVVEPRAAG
jgi:O-antigen/teichoic acid export membrane protein